jgi:hypothetical protein
LLSEQPPKGRSRWAATGPATVALWFLDRNLACFFVVTTMGFVVSYGWLHLACHLPATSFIG